MKKITLLIIALLLTSVSYSQKNFKWEKSDSLNKTKTQIYTSTKMFIAEQWKSAQNVIQMDDKEAGIIIIKGSSIQKTNWNLNTCIYIYNYTITFKMKDNKFKMSLDNVYCESASTGSGSHFDIIKIEPFDGEYIKGETGFGIYTIPERKAIPMMASLKSELQSIVDSYDIYIKKANSDW